MESIWESRSFAKPIDLIVVGAGITGLFTAFHVSRRDPSRRILVLERGPHPIGASVKNAGFACFGSPSELLRDLATEGESIAMGRVEERWLGLQELRATLGDEAIGFEPVGGYELFSAGSRLHGPVAAGLAGLNKLLRPIIGPERVFRWVDERIPTLGLAAEHLSWNPLEGAVDSGRLMRSLLHVVRSAGVEVVFNAEATHWQGQAQHAEVQLKDGRTLKAGALVLATNGFTRQLVPGSDIAPGRGQVVLTGPLPGLQLKGTFHAEEGFYYFRHCGDDRVLLGGGRQLDIAGETTLEDGVTDLIQSDLEALLEGVILPGKPFTIERRWSGVMGFRARGGPAVVEPLAPHVVLAAGLGGIGVAIGIRLARRAAELVA